MMLVVWTVAASFFFATMGVCIKMAAVYFSPAEMVFYRGVVGTLIIGMLAHRTRVSMRTSVPWMHTWRSIVGVSAMGAWFYAMTHLPLATAVTLNYMSSVWLAVFMIGGSLLTWYPSRSEPRPPFQGALVVTVLIGFAGVVLMLRPNLNEGQTLASLVGLLSGMIAALAYMQVVALSRVGEPELRTVFYFGAGTLVAGGLVMWWDGAHSLFTWTSLWLIPLGVLSALGQLCLTRAYTTAAHTQRGTLVVANLQYSGIIFAGLYSLWLFDDVIPRSGWVGVGLIVISGIAATALRGRVTTHTASADER